MMVESQLPVMQTFGISVCHRRPLTLLVCPLSSRLVPVERFHTLAQASSLPERRIPGSTGFHTTLKTRARWPLRVEVMEGVEVASQTYTQPSCGGRKRTVGGPRRSRRQRTRECQREGREGTRLLL